MKRSIPVILAISLATLSQSPLGQWTHQYPRVEGASHQLYLEQENLPILSSGPINPAPSPDGEQIAFSHQGWIWLLDLESRVARQLTDAAGIDGRPRWSPDGELLAFVRDVGTDTAIVVKRLSDGEETLVDTPAIELDPEFTRDGNGLLYTSARSGHLEIWQRDLATAEDEKRSVVGDLARAARSLADGGIVYHAQDYPSYGLRVREADDQTDRLLFEQGWMAHLDPDVHPSGRSMVYSVGHGNDLRLAVMDIDQPGFPRWLTAAGGRALHPAFSSDGTTIYFVEANTNQQFELRQVDVAGGSPSAVEVTRWDYIDPVGKAAIATTRENGEPAPARVSVTRLDGHPVANPGGPNFVDNNNGDSYFYSPGSIDLDLPQGQYRIVATRGPFSMPVERNVEVSAGGTLELVMPVPEIWSPGKAGYASADHHIHLNASGVAELDLADLLLFMQGEALDSAAPMAWNQYNRFIDAHRVGQTETTADGTSAILSQEVRSDFHGHLGMIGLKDAFHPWFFGPVEPVYSNRDFNNGQAIGHARTKGALATYVHPIGGHADPFADLAANSLPHELVIDGVLTDGVGLELVCQWTSSLGTAEVWYRFLTIGKAMPATAGTDMMANFYRIPAIGTARAYVPVAANDTGFAAVVEQVRKGTGFVTTGPGLLFEVNGSTPGETVEAGTQSWNIELVSVRPVEKLEIIVNGEIVKTFDGFDGEGSKRYSGTVDLPEGGWIAARAVGGETGWPSMSVFQFAHSSPIWIDHIGSTDPAAAQAAASDLLRALDYSETRFIEGYAGAVPAGLQERIDQARRELEALAR
ncbi:CehA/McbA family metallohydrolase [Roseovarius sp.]|uniref:CehA/McbA family metallohydrolase n=1 Tax=Roseovarius sp. TaxID=1486281 RepID=UPI003565E310